MTTVFLWCFKPECRHLLPVIEEKEESNWKSQTLASPYREEGTAASNSDGSFTAKPVAVASEVFKVVDSPIQFQVHSNITPSYSKPSNAFSVPSFSRCYCNQTQRREAYRYVQLKLSYSPLSAVNRTMLSHYRHQNPFSLFRTTTTIYRYHRSSNVGVEFTLTAIHAIPPSSW